MKNKYWKEKWVLNVGMWMNVRWEKGAKNAAITRQFGSRERYLVSQRSP